MESPTIHSTYPAIDFSLPNLSFERLTPLSPLNTHTYNQGTPVTDLLDHTTPTKTTKTTTETNKMQMMEFRHSSLQLYTQSNEAPVSSSPESSETSSVSLWTPSYISSSVSASSEDWIIENLSNLDVLAPTVPDLSFSFATAPRQKSPVPRVSTLPIGSHNYKTPSIEADYQDSRSKGSRPTTADSSSSCRPTSSHLKKSPLLRPNGRTILGGSLSPNASSSTIGRAKSNGNKKNYGFLNHGNRCRNSSYLESQLDFLAQHQSPMFNNNINNQDELMMVVQSQEHQMVVEHVQRGNESFNKSIVDASKKGRKGSFSKLSGHSNGVMATNEESNRMGQDSRQRRLSSSMLLDRANNFLFNSKRSSKCGTEIDDPSVGCPKAWSDPTLSNSSIDASPPRVKPSRSFFNLFSSKFK